MAGFDITLHYNTTMLDVVNVELGPFALNYNLTFQIIKEVNDEDCCARIRMEHGGKSCRTFKACKTLNKFSAYIKRG